ncbi:unannotated protein [freshwater metagenome]|uniref:Unannotated protein n=1 Tax=freshwater metagenome TaxID=449393 RepID=A0A6J6GXN8_9ZZZZ
MLGLGDLAQPDADLLGGDREEPGGGERFGELGGGQLDPADAGHLDLRAMRHRRGVDVPAVEADVRGHRCESLRCDHQVQPIDR